MTNMKISSKMHLFIIISSLIVVIGVAVGLVCQFIAGGYFNYGAEFKSYNTVEVNYAYVDYSDEDKVIEICDGVIGNAGVSYFEYSSGDTDDGGRVIFKFSKSCDENTLRTVASDIQTALRSGSGNTQSNAYFHSLEARLNGGRVLTFASIALASAVVLQLLYFMVRYKLTMAFTALLANVHNLAIYVSLLTITRVPVGISAVALGGLTVLATMIACAFLFDRYRRNLKKEKYERASADELTDICVSESFKSILYPVVGIAAAAIVIFVMLSVSAMSVTAALSPVVAGLVCAVSALYGTGFFIPSVYTRIKSLGDKAKARSKNNK